MLNAHVTLDPVEVLYIATLLSDRHRPIDGYIDYFGSGPVAPGAFTSPAGSTRSEAV